MVLNIWNDRQIANNMDENNNIQAAQQPDIDALMAKVLCGDCTPQEYDCFSSWLAADESNRVEFQKVRSYWNADISDRFDIDTGKELERLMKRVRSPRGSKRKRFFNYAVRASIVAAVLLSEFSQDGRLLRIQKKYPINILLLQEIRFHLSFCLTGAKFT